MSNHTFLDVPRPLPGVVMARFIHPETENLDLFESTPGLCANAELLWIGMLGMCILGDIDPPLYEYTDAAGEVIAIILKKEPVEGMDFGDETGLVIWNQDQRFNLSIVTPTLYGELLARPINKKNINPLIFAPTHSREDIKLSAEVYKQIAQQMRDQGFQGEINPESTLIFLVQWVYERFDLQEYITQYLLHQ